MKILVTDTGLIWNHKNPYLEKYKEAVIVVCLEGEKVTDKYKCFVSPYKPVGTGIDQYGTQSQKYLALESVADDLNRKMGYHDDVLILADGNPDSLYPFFALKDRKEYYRLHLCAMTPWRFETKSKINIHKFLLNDLSSLNSFLYMDSNEILNSMDEQKKLPDLIEQSTEYFGKLLPRILNGINKMDCYYENFFDFKTMSYIPADKGFKSIDIKKKIEEINDIDFDIRPFSATLGMVLGPPAYPEDCDDARKKAEKIPVRVNGKQICNLLREMRIQLAKANGIKFESEICPSIGACAGTCAKCDEELKFLQRELKKIPEAERVYPQFDLNEEV